MSAAGLPLVAGVGLFTGAALGREGKEKEDLEAKPEEAYSETKAATIHRDSMEKAIREDGKDPEEVKKQVRARMLELRDKASDIASV